MTIEKYVQGYFCLNKNLNVDKVFGVVDNFIHIYKAKHYYELVKILSKGESTSGWYDRRDKVFERYCGINYNNILRLLPTK